MNIKLSAKLLHALALSITPMGRQALAAEAEYERDCVELEMVTGHKAAHIQAAIVRVASESRHQQSLVPAHLYQLIQNNWRVESAPEQQKWAIRLQYPTDCTQGCLSKFYHYLEEQSA